MNFILLDTATAPTSMTALSTILMVVIMLAVMYFFVVRPQKKQEKETANMLNNLSVGDEITTIGGVIGEIVSITLGEHGETEGIFEGAVDGVIPQIIKGQTTEVDVVSGATITSNAIIEAVEDIMNQAA